MKKIIFIIVSMFLVTSCNSNKDYEKLKEENELLLNEYNKIQSLYEINEKSLERLEKDYNRLEKQYYQLERKYLREVESTKK